MVSTWMGDYSWFKGGGKGPPLYSTYVIGAKKNNKKFSVPRRGPVFLMTSFKIFKKQYNYFWSGGGGGGGPAGGADSARHQAAGQGQGQQGQEDQPGCGEVQEDSRRGDISDHF